MTQGEALLSAGRWLASAGLLVDTAQVRGIAHGQAEQAEDTFWPHRSPQLSLVCGQSQQGTQGVARSGAVCPAGRMAGPCLSRCRETPQPLTEAAVGPKEPGGAAAGPGGRVTGAPVETPTQQLTARPEPPRRAPCGGRGQLPGSGGSQSPSPLPGHHSCGPGGRPGQHSHCWQPAPWKPGAHTQAPEAGWQAWFSPGQWHCCPQRSPKVPGGQARGGGRGQSWPGLEKAPSFIPGPLLRAELWGPA